MTDEFSIIDENEDIGGIIGDVSKYSPREIEEPVRKEPIGEFDGTITRADIVTGEKDGRKWARVDFAVGIDDMGVFPNNAFITLWLGDKPPMYPEDCEQTQTEIFLDTMFTAGLELPDLSKDGFGRSVAGLKGQRCRIRSWVMRKKNPDTGKMEEQFSDKGYKKYKARFIAKSTLPENAPF
jgi:hypothetical protein